MKDGGVVPEFVVDLPGVKAALTTKNNQVRSAVIDAIQCGRMLIIRSVSDELRDLYPSIYEDFKALKPRKYISVTMAHESLAGVMMESYGGSMFTSVPVSERFDALALSQAEKLKLVTAGKALKDSKAIVRKCGLNGPGLIGIDDFL